MYQKNSNFTNGSLEFSVTSSTKYLTLYISGSGLFGKVFDSSTAIDIIPVFDGIEYRDFQLLQDGNNAFEIKQSGNINCYIDFDY